MVRLFYFFHYNLKKLKTFYNIFFHLPYYLKLTLQAKLQHVRY